MRVACSACGLEYSIPDHRVQGRRLKFRCKRCGTEVPIDGTHLGPRLPQSTPVMQAIRPPETDKPEFSLIQPLAPPSSPTSTPAAEPASTRPKIARSEPLPPPSVKPVVRPPRPSNPVSPASVDLPKRSEPPISQPGWADVDALMKPSSARHDVPQSAWVVDLGADVLETMSTAEICELYVRGTVTLSTPLKSSDGGDWRPLSSVPEVSDALTARGISLLPRIGLSTDEEGSEPKDVDFSAPTRQLKADQLWAEAGLKSSRSRDVGIHDAETAMIETRKMLGESSSTGPAKALPSLKADEASDDAETLLYQGPSKSDLGPRPAPPTLSQNQLNLIRMATLAAALLLIVAVVLLIFVWPYLFAGAR